MKIPESPGEAEDSLPPDPPDGRDKEGPHKVEVWLHTGHTESPPGQNSDTKRAPLVLWFLQ